MDTKQTTLTEVFLHFFSYFFGNMTGFELNFCLPFFFDLWPEPKPSSRCVTIPCFHRFSRLVGGCRCRDQARGWTNRQTRVGRCSWGRGEGLHFIHNLGFFHLCKLFMKEIKLLLNSDCFRYFLLIIYFYFMLYLSAGVTGQAPVPGKAGCFAFVFWSSGRRGLVQRFLQNIWKRKIFTNCYIHEKKLVAS